MLTLLRLDAVHELGGELTSFFVPADAERVAGIAEELRDEGWYTDLYEESIERAPPATLNELLINRIHPNAPTVRLLAACWFDTDGTRFRGVCLVCGCTRNQACIDVDSGLPCHWVEPDLCSVCVGRHDPVDLAALRLQRLLNQMADDLGLTFFAPSPLELIVDDEESYEITDQVPRDASGPPLEKVSVHS